MDARRFMIVDVNQSAALPFVRSARVSSRSSEFAKACFSRAL
jgi:hypothetical protein